MNNLEIMEQDVEFRGRTITVSGALGYGPNYTFTGKSKVVKDVKVFQIVAIDEFYSITPGTIGGWVSSSECLCQEDRSWITEEVVLIDSTVIGDSFISGDTEIVKSTINGTHINEDNVKELDSVVRIIESTLDTVFINGEATIKNSSVKKTKVNEIAADYPNLSLVDSEIDNSVVTVNEELKIKESRLTSLDLSASGIMVQVELSGAVSRTHRPEICLEREFPQDCCNIKYKGYLPVDEYDDIKFHDVLVGMKESTRTVNTEYGSVRADIAEFLGL